MKRYLFILSFILAAGISVQAQTARTISSPSKEIIIKTYPVPANTYINIELEKSDSKKYTLTIYNFLGRKIFEKPNFSQKATVTLEEFTRGVYIYHLSDAAGKLVKSGKFQVSK